MIDRYPHMISIKEQPASPRLDEHGDPVPAASNWSRRLPCRYETDGRSNIRVEKDGSLKTYAFVVYLPSIRPKMDFAGKYARLYGQNGELVCEGLINHSNALQLSTVLYLEKCR